MKKVYKLIDRSLVLATEVEENLTTVTVKAPLSVTQTFNPATGQPEVVMIPMDLIFSEADSGKDVVTFKKEHIMYEKPMSDFPAYEMNYNMQVTGIETVQKSGIIV
jgi:hypothetical protein